MVMGITLLIGWLATIITAAFTGASKADFYCFTIAFMMTALGWAITLRNLSRKNQNYMDDLLKE
jgi:hypothetical protein